MSNQTKVTDFFVTQKKSCDTLRHKNIKIGSELSTNDSKSSEQSVVLEKTPKRKKVVKTANSVKSSKRKKTPKHEVIIEFKTNNEVKTESIVSTNESTIDVKNEKQLNAIEVKERLSKCNNLLELKKQLAKINGCEAKLKQFKEIKVKSPLKKGLRTPTKWNRSPAKYSPNRPMISNTPILSPIAPMKSPVMRMTPNKDPMSPMTYRRRLFDVFEDQVSSPQKLVNSSVNSSEDVNRSLVLPKRFKILAEIFKSMDTIVSMYYKRQEVCTFDKLKESVERMTSKVFDTKRLAQIQTVFCNAFKLKYELFSCTLDNRKPSYQLIISPNYNSNVDIRTNSIHLLERYKLFVQNLLDTTKEYHNKYLNDLGLSVDNNELTQWHPFFKADTVPDIVPNDNALPLKPKFGEKTAELFLETSRHRLGIASTTATTEDIKSNDSKSEDKTTDSNKKITKGIFKGISIDLLNKVRAKEAAKVAHEMTRKPEVEKELRILRSLPELIRIIHSFIIGSKKISIPYDQLIDKLIDSFSSSLSILRAREHLDYLCELLPHWIFQIEARNQYFIKIDKQKSIASLEDSIEQKINHLNKKFDKTF